MTLLSGYNAYYRTGKANVVSADLPAGVIAFGADGKIVGVNDPYHQLVTLLLHMNGADASTTFTDDSLKGHTPTAAGDAQLNTADFKYGTAAGLFDGTGDYVTFPYVSADFNWYGSSFTVEGWVKASSWTNWEGSGGQPNMIGRMTPTSTTAYWSFGPVADGTLAFFYYNGSAVWINTVTTVPTDEWVHLAMTYNIIDDTIRIFINGILENSAVKSGSPQSSVGDMTIGSMNNTALAGSLDDLRITQYFARYLADFVPPTQQFPDS